MHATCWVLVQGGVAGRAREPAYSFSWPQCSLLPLTPSSYAPQELHPGVMLALERASAIVRPRFRDAEFARNRRRAAGGGGVSRSWYVAVDIWLAGTAAGGAGVAATNPFGDDEPTRPAGRGSVPPDAVALLPEDPNQPCCALSGEPFEKAYDQDTDAWMFRGARRLTGTDAARYGVPDGALVKVKCLAEAGLGSGAAALVAAAAGGGELQQQSLQEAEMAAAAAAAPAADGLQQRSAAASSNGAEVKQQPPDSVDPASVHTDAAAASAKLESAVAGVKREASAPPDGAGMEADAAKRVKLELAGS